MWALLLISACNNDDDNASVNIFGDSVNVAFYSKSGVNIIDSLGLNEAGNTQIATENFLSATIIRGSDGFASGAETHVPESPRLGMSHSLNFITPFAFKKVGEDAWKSVGEKSSERYKVAATYGSYLHLPWGDLSVSNASPEKGEVKNYDETYTIRLICEPIFGDYNTHDIKLYYHIAWSKGVIYKCEFDGKDTEISNDKMYQIAKDESDSDVSASQIIIRCVVD